MKSKGLIRVISTLTLLCFISCSSDSEDIEIDSSNIQKLEFTNKSQDIYLGEELIPELKIHRENSVEKYNENNSYNLEWSSRESPIASISSKGVLKGESLGSTRIFAQTPDNKNKVSLDINVLKPNKLDSPLSSEMIYTSGYMLNDNSVMQSFDISNDGCVYYSQVGRGSNNYNVILIKKKNNTASIESRMLLPYSGHGNNIAIEQDGSNTYAWVSSYGTRSSSNDYTQAQTVARIKYIPGATLKPSECTEHYWIPERRNIQASLDTENDLALFWCTNSTYSTRYFYIYRLSEIKALPTESKQLSFRITWGGVNGEAEVTETPTAMVKDLSQLEPISTIMMPQNSPLTVGKQGNQGHDIKNGKIYYYEGAGNNNDGKQASTATMTIMDLNGKFISRNEVAAIKDLGTLNSLGLTSTGYMEPEGIKLYNGVLYCGFASKSTDDVRRAVILQYDLSK